MINILVVKDVEDVHSMLVELFQSEGYNVYSAYDGLEAVNVFRNEVIDLVLLDIMLPYKSGDELVREFRQIS